MEPPRTFLLVLPPRYPVGVNVSIFPSVTAPFKRTHERTSFKSVAYKKEVMGRYANAV